GDSGAVADEFWNQLNILIQPDSIMFKYVKIITLVMIAGLFASCSDLLEEEVHTEVSDSRYNTPDGFNEAVNAAYYPLRSFYGTEQGLTATVFGTDTYREGA